MGRQARGRDLWGVGTSGVFFCGQADLIQVSEIPLGIPDPTKTPALAWVDVAGIFDPSPWGLLGPTPIELPLGHEGHVIELQSSLLSDLFCSFLCSIEPLR